MRRLTVMTLVAATLGLGTVVASTGGAQAQCVSQEAYKPKKMVYFR